MFLFLFHVLTACLSFVHIPSCSCFCDVLPLRPPSLHVTFTVGALPCRAAVATLPLRPLSCVTHVPPLLHGTFAMCVLHHVSPATVTLFIFFLSLFHLLTAPLLSHLHGTPSCSPLCHALSPSLCAASSCVAPSFCVTPLSHVALLLCFAPHVAPWMDVGLCRCGNWVGCRRHGGGCRVYGVV